MDFEVPEKTQELVQRFERFLREEVFPMEPKLAGKRFKDVLPVLGEGRERVKRAGLWAPQVPVEYGGMGLGFRDHALVSEVLGKSPVGHYLFGCQAPDAGNMEILIQYGTDEQKERWLKPLARGEIRSCFSMTEPERAGSNPTWLETSAVKDGDDFVINGTKWFTSSADGAAFAIVMAVTDPNAAPHARASQIIVPTDTPGFRLVRNISVMGDEGSDWASHAEVAYEDCRVPQQNLLGPESAGFMIAQERLGPGRIHHCMRWIGICERAFELMCARAAKRDIAPGRPLGTRQMVQEWIAESRAEINAARLSVQHAAWKIDKHGLYAAREEISCIKFYVAGILGRVLDRAIQTHGALGVTDDTPLSAYYRHERAARIYDGPDEVHKAAVARRILKHYGLEVASQASGI
jgi:acyl-CoA dehydrogenase